MKGNSVLKKPLRAKIKIKFHVNLFDPFVMLKNLSVFMKSIIISTMLKELISCERVHDK